MRTWCVSYGHGDDRDVIRVKAKTASEAVHEAYIRVGPVGNVWPVRRTKKEMKGE